MAFVTLIQNDEATVQFPLNDASGNRLNLNGATVNIRVFFLGSDAQDRGVLDNVDGVQATIDNADRGLVSYTFDAEDLAWAGTYYAQFEVDDGTDSEWYPKGTPFDIEVLTRYGATTPGTINAQGSLTGSLDLNGYSLLNGSVIEGLTLRDADTGTTYDISDLSTGGGGGSGGVTVIDENTVTATGGASPAASETVTISGAAEGDKLIFLVYPDPSATQPDVDYSFNYDFSRDWDQSAGAVDISYIVNWDTDPGGGNDVTLRWQAIGPALAAGNTPDVYDSGGEQVVDPFIHDFRAGSGLSVSVSEPTSGTARMRYLIPNGGITTSLLNADAVTAPKLAADAVVPDSIDATNSPTDGQVATYDSGSGTWTWADAPTGSGGDSKRDISDTVSIPAGGILEYPIFHKNGESVELTRWGISLSEGGTDTDLQLEFNPPPTGDAPTSTLTLDAAIKDASGSPIDSHTAGGSENAIVRLTLNHTNSSGADYQAGAGNGAVQIFFEYQRV